MAVTIEPLLPHAAAFIVAASRVAGLMVFAPILSSRSIPRLVRVLMAVGLSAAVYPSVIRSAPGGVAPVLSLDLYALAPLLAGEMLIGASVGLIGSIPMMAVQLAGVTMGQQIGLGIAQVVNPATDIEGNELGQLLFLLALAAFLMLGGLEALVGAVLHSFSAVPLGGFGTSRAPLEVLVGMLSAGFELAARVAMPVLAIIFIESVAVGFIMKTIPAINIMTFGFPVRIMLGLFVLLASLPGSAEAIGVGVEAAIEAAQGWALGLGPGPPAGAGDG